MLDKVWGTYKVTGTVVFNEDPDRQVDIEHNVMVAPGMDATSAIDAFKTTLLERDWGEGEDGGGRIHVEEMSVQSVELLAEADIVPFELGDLGLDGDDDEE